MAESRSKRLTWWAAVLVLGVAAHGAESQPKATIVLDTGSYWRTYEVLRNELVGKTPGDAHLDPPAKGSGISYNTPLPPSNWMQAEFDAPGWTREPGPFLNGMNAYGFGRNHLALLCARGQFTVTDPAQAKDLTVSVAYRGGVAAYVNGRELRRGHLTDGNVAPDTAAEAYPLDVSVKPDGTIIKQVGLGRPGEVQGPLRTAHPPARQHPNPERPPPQGDQRARGRGPSLAAAS